MTSDLYRVDGGAPAVDCRITDLSLGADALPADAQATDSKEDDPENPVNDVRGNMTKRVREWVPGTGEWYAGYTE